jgi:(2Fe-2S) ferredoxin
MTNKQSKTTIFIGAGTCGLGAGADATVQAARAYLNEKGIEADIIRVGCIGLCAQEPLLDVKLPDRTRISFKKAKDKLVPKILDAVFSGKLTNNKQIFGQFRPRNGDKPWDEAEYLDELPFFKPQTRFRPEIPDLQRRRGRSRGLHGPGRDRERSAPAGRGHGHRRLRHRRHQGLRLHPRRVSAGHQAAEGGHRPGRGQRLLGTNILGSGFTDIIIKMGAGAFVCGEETALIHSIEGKRGMPRPGRRFPPSADCSASRRSSTTSRRWPTCPPWSRTGRRVVQRPGHQDEQGHEGLRPVRQGLAHRPGRSGHGHAHPQIVFDIGGGIPNGKAYKAVQIGGPSGGCIPTQHLDIDVDYESLKTVGAIMGSGGLVVMDEDTCMVDVAKFFMDFIQRESCGKCIPCREGTKTPACAGLVRRLLIRY